MFENRDRTYHQKSGEVVLTNSLSNQRLMDNYHAWPGYPAS